MPDPVERPGPRPGSRVSGPLPGDLPDEDEHYYDPGADEGTEPWPLRHYEGTRVGALYGGDVRPWIKELAGWTLPRPTNKADQLEGWDYEPGGTPA